jgi:ferritin-like metal-binding protein YciE
MFANDDIRDAGLIGALQRMAHYQIAGYGTVRTFAFRLSDTGAADCLPTILDESVAVDRKLSAIAEGSVNLNAGQRTKTEFDVSIF